MPDKEFFLNRCLESIDNQTLKDYEIVITEEGLMAHNTNAAIKRAQGEIVKILYMDDFFAHENALKNIVDNFTGGWLVSGCVHARKDGYRFNPHMPSYNQAIHTGINSIGSPSVLAFENKDPLLFDEGLSWLLDVDLYKRLYEKYGEPVILNDVNVVIGVGSHQTTHTLPDETKQAEFDYVIRKYA